MTTPLHGVQLNRNSSLRRIGGLWSLSALISDRELCAFLQATGRGELVALLVPDCPTIRERVPEPA